MSRTRYDESNHGKASFDEAYIAPTPHRYLASMAAIGYRLAERMHPFLSAVVHASSSAEAPLRVLDVGCSYGISSALLKTGCSYGALSRSTATTRVGTTMSACERPRNGCRSTACART